MDEQNALSANLIRRTILEVRARGELPVVDASVSALRELGLTDEEIFSEAVDPAHIDIAQLRTRAPLMWTPEGMVRWEDASDLYRDLEEEDRLYPERRYQRIKLGFARMRNRGSSWEGIEKSYDIQIPLEDRILPPPPPPPQKLR